MSSESGPRKETTPRPTGGGGGGTHVFFPPGGDTRVSVPAEIYTDPLEAQWCFDVAVDECSSEPAMEEEPFKGRCRAGGTERGSAHQT